MTKSSSFFLTSCGVNGGVAVLGVSLGVVLGSLGQGDAFLVDGNAGWGVDPSLEVVVVARLLAQANTSGM